MHCQHKAATAPPRAAAAAPGNLCLMLLLRLRLRLLHVLLHVLLCLLLTP